MGVVSFALRTAICKTLRGSTIAGPHVYDSPVEPLDMVTGPNATGAPVIAVFVSEMKKNSVQGRDVAGASAEAEVTIQIYAPAEFNMSMLAADGSPIEVRVGGEGIAVALDFAERQIERVFAMSDTEWGKLFRRLITSYANVHSMRILVRVGDAQNGVNIPMAELTYTCKTIFEPAYSSEMDALWQQIYDALAADEAYEGIAEMLKALIEAPEGVADWRLLQGLLGATYGEIVNVASGDPGGAVEPLNVITIEAQP